MTAPQQHGRRPRERLRISFAWRCGSIGGPALAVAVLVTLAAPSLATDNLEPIGASMQAVARGGADVAVGDSVLSQIDNPAALANIHDYRIDGMVDLALVRAPWKGVYETAVSERRVIPLGNAGLSVPIDDRFTLGFAMHSRAGLGTRFYARHLLIPFMDRRVESDLKIVDFQFNVGYKLTDRLSIGGGPLLQVATSEFSTVLGPADIEFGRGYAYGGGFHVGLHYQARDDLAFGLAYRSPSWCGDLQGGDGKASLLGLLPVPLGRASIEDFHLGQRIAIGAAWDLTKRLKLAGEVRWYNMKESTFHDTTVVMDGVIRLPYPFPLGYRNQWAFMLGADYRLTDRWVLSGGYHYCTAPVSRSNVLPVGSTTWQHHASVGLRYEADTWWAGGGYTVAFPTWLRGDGWSKIPLGVDYGNADMTQLENAIVIGFGVTLGTPAHTMATPSGSKSQPTTRTGLSL